MIDHKQIQAAIREHGASLVYKAACSAFANRQKLMTVGISAADLADVNAVMSAAFAQLGDAARAIDYARTTAALDRLA